MFDEHATHRLYDIASEGLSETFLTAMGRSGRL